MRIGFIGCGKMAEAMASGLLSAGLVRPSQIHGGDVDTSRLKTLRKRYGIRTCAHNSEVFQASDVVFLSVKPYQIQSVLNDVKGVINDGHLIISIAAGVPLQAMESILDQGRFVRVMPNMPCLVSAGMSVFSLGSRTTTQDRRTVNRLLSSFGQVMELPETVFDSVTAISGSGPAFFSYLLNKMANGATKKGLDRKTALKLAIQTMFGTAKLLMEHGTDPDELVTSVATPNGTTAAGLAVMDKRGTGTILRDAVRAAAKRCRELAPQRSVRTVAGAAANSRTRRN